MGAIISSFFAYLINWITYAAKYFAGVMAGCFDALYYYANLILLKLVNPVFDLLVNLLDGSGIPSAITVVNTMFTGGLGFWANYFMLPTSLTLLVGAYMLRFVIRRIPFIG